MKIDRNCKRYIAEYTEEAKEQLYGLHIEDRKKIVAAICAFEELGTDYKNINNLGDGLYEVKPSGVRAYFMYDKKRKRIIIVGFICLKKTQEAPKRFMAQARRNIQKYIIEMEKDNEKNNN